MLDQAHGEVVIKTGRFVFVTFAVLGIFCTLVAVAIPLLLLADGKADGTESLMLLLLASLPGLGGYFCLTRLKRLLKTRIVLDDLGLRLNIPVWSGGLLRAGQEVHLSWNQISRVTHECVGYNSIKGAAVDEYTIHSSLGSYTLTKNICPHPEKVADMIAARAGQSVEDLTPESTVRWNQLPSREKRKLFFIFFTIALLSILFIAFTIL